MKTLKHQLFEIYFSKCFSRLLTHDVTAETQITYYLDVGHGISRGLSNDLSSAGKSQAVVIGLELNRRLQGTQEIKGDNPV